MKPIKPIRSKIFGDQFFFRTLKDNAVWINIEHAARAIGLVTSNGDIQWDEINRLLKSFGYQDTVGAGDYIPLNFFFKLAITVNTEEAAGFKDWITDRVLPKIFTTGKYDIAEDDVGEAIIRAKLRTDSKEVYKEATQEFKMHIKLARSQGDNRPEGRIYATFAGKVNKLAGLPHKNGRDGATAKQLAVVVLGTQMQQEESLIGRERKRWYLATEKAMDKRLNQFAAILPKSVPTKKVTS